MKLHIEKDLIYQKISLPDYYAGTNEIGIPQIPLISFSLGIPELDLVKISILDSSILKINNFNLLAEKYQTNSYIEKYSIFNAGYVYLKYLNNYELAEEKFNELAEKYPNDALVLETKYLLGETVSVNSFDAAYSKLIASDSIKINRYELQQNYPNPFNPITTIKYQIPTDGFVTLKVYDILGAEVATLVNEEKVGGKYEVNFNAKNLSSGIYIYTLRVNNFVSSKKIILMK